MHKRLVKIQHAQVVSFKRAPTDDAKNGLDKCQLKIVFSNKEFTFETNQKHCESYIRCGYNANLNDAIFSEANKVSNENYSTCEEATQDPR